MNSVKYQIKFHIDTNSIDDKILKNVEAILKSLEDENVDVESIVPFSTVKAECKTIYQETKLKN